MTEFLFTSERSWQKADEIVDYLRGPRLWVPRVDYPDLDAWIEKVHAQLKSEAKRALVAFQGGQVVGAVVYQRHVDAPEVLEVKNITVRPDMRGRHIASFLLRNAEIEGAHDFGAREVVADAKVQNLAIRAYLFRNGYRSDDVKDLYGLGAGADVVYRKALPRGTHGGPTVYPCRMAKSGARPFIKWAGGKTQLLPAISKVLPKKTRTYFEPFIGGGAVFFAMGEEARFEHAILNDWNTELVDAYRVVRDFPDDLIKKLTEHMGQDWNTVEYFNQVRAQKTADMGPVERTARMVYLNKTCFNGLYRVNKSGQFNVPFGKYKNPSLFDELNLRACSALLNRTAELRSGDFSNAVEGAEPGDVVYFDPPYVPVSATSNFASYTSGGFTINDQHRLMCYFKQLTEQGLICVLSNSDTESVRALYSDFHIISVQAKRHINSKGTGRGFVGEVLVVNDAELAKSVEGLPLQVVEQEVPGYDTVSE